MATQAYTITRWLEFDIGHRVMRDGSKCARLHGHRYGIAFTLGAPTLDKAGKVLDFGFIKQEWGSWIEDRADHGIVLYEQDPLVSFLCTSPEPQKICAIPYQATAEGIAQWLYEVFEPKALELGLNLIDITVRETPNCEAHYGQTAAVQVHRKVYLG